MSGRRRGRARRTHEVLESEIEITGLDDAGRGVGRDQGKVVFVSGALPGEQVRYRCVRRLRSHDEAELVEVLVASSDRVEPRCAHHDICGGCALQHMAPSAQIAAKQQVMLDALNHIGGVRPERVDEPLRDEPWGYRRKARLGVKHVPGKGGVLVGFREKRMPYIADIQGCEVLVPQIGQRIRELRALLDSLQARARIPQIEVAVGDTASVLVFRNLDPLVEADLERLREFARHSGVAVYLQPGGYDSIEPLYPEQGVELCYRLPESDLELQFDARDFVQVNARINARLVAIAVEALDLDASDRVLDLFCGLGNFSLAIARRAAEVLGLELGAAMVERAARNARHNGIDNARFEVVDLSMGSGLGDILQRGFDKLLLDPPRSGAREVIEQLGGRLPRRIVYVSCNPATLARDAGLLVHTHGYRLQTCAAVDMFPHTSHVESLAVFVRETVA
ncbi:MAG: 23S rRNA (uracil(1939)-C(5))-methyltransferase RlmD [Gammaproteobacteria bacterium]|nr:23S rRNA (uracil(1939)-C(5))-methyltransferase RlmD [Gammaproteobacteria bacterium]